MELDDRTDIENVASPPGKYSSGLEVEEKQVFVHGWLAAAS